LSKSLIVSCNTSVRQTFIYAEWLSHWKDGICNLARSAKLPIGLYILLALISSFLFFYYEQSYLSIYWTDFHDFFHHMEDICVNFLDPVQFFRFLKERCHGNQFCGKSVAKLPNPLHLSLYLSETEWDIATSMCALTV